MIGSELRTFLWQITFPPHPLPLVTEKAETTTCFSICESQSPLARKTLLCEQRRTDHRRVPKDNHIFEYPWNLVKWQNTTRVSLKKFSQLNSDIQSYRCKDFSLKQVSGLMGGRGGGSGPPDPPPGSATALVPFDILSTAFGINSNTPIASYRCTF